MHNGHCAYKFVLGLEITHQTHITHKRLLKRLRRTFSTRTKPANAAEMETLGKLLIAIGLWLAPPEPPKPDAATCSDAGWAYMRFVGEVLNAGPHPSKEKVAAIGEVWGKPHIETWIACGFMKRCDWWCRLKSRFSS